VRQVGYLQELILPGERKCLGECPVLLIMYLCCVYLCIRSIGIFFAMGYFFPYISVYFAGTMSSLLGMVPPRYLSLQID
jgi:hypothetical protein